MVFSFMEAVGVSANDNEPSSYVSDDIVSSESGESETNIISSSEPKVDLAAEELMTAKAELEKLPEAILSLAMPNDGEKKVIGIESSKSEDLSSITAINDDGSRTLTMFDEPIKYIDSNTGKVEYIDSTLIESMKDGVAYENKANKIEVLLPEIINDGVNVNMPDANGKEKYVIKMTPQTEKTANQKASSVNKFASSLSEVCEYSSVFGSFAHLQYSPISTGLKESIVLDKYTGQNEFAFVVEAKGLRAELRDEILPEPELEWYSIFINTYWE